jgi:diguanylate cyclase (GGDEF)-like protein/PAS domain S-box-containing protein
MQEILIKKEFTDIFNQLVDQIPEGIWIRDTLNGTIVYNNPPLNKLAMQSNLLGRPVSDLYQLFHPEDRAEIEKDVETHKNGGLDKDYRIEREDGDYRWVNIRTFPIKIEDMEKLNISANLILNSIDKNIINKNITDKINYVGGIMMDVTARKVAERAIYEVANHDPLTGLPNRNLFYNYFQDIFIKCLEQQNDLSLLSIDLDGFKQINDTIGHSGGDALLRHVALRLKNLLGAFEDTFLARLGGDEFVILVLNQKNKISHLANIIIQELKRPFSIDGHNWQLGGSIGISIYPQDSAGSLSTMLQFADMAMYEAKNAGKNTYRFYKPELSEKANQKRILENDLQKAFIQKEFVIYYQPKISIEDGRITGLEALLRWKKKNELIHPNYFIPVLEETNLIIPVGEWVINEVCKQMHFWDSIGINYGRVAVNVSAKQFFC